MLDNQAIDIVSLFVVVAVGGLVLGGIAAALLYLCRRKK